MKKTDNIKFELNKELDKQMAFIFLSRTAKVGGVNFSQGVTKLHPSLGEAKVKGEEDRKDLINKYFDKYYEDHDEELKMEIIEFKNRWSKVELKFIEQINKIFKNPNLPKGKYIGYLSIINCNPRFLDSKTFQIFNKHRAGSNLVTAHEVLHFFFYDYAENKYPEIFKELDANKGVYWMLAELFNDMILSLPEFIEIHGNKEVQSYPKHQEYSEYMKKLWSDNPDIDNWIIEAYNYLSKEN